jgi:hypothetical protein
MAVPVPGGMWFISEYLLADSIGNHPVRRPITYITNCVFDQHSRQMPGIANNIDQIDTIRPRTHTPDFQETLLQFLVLVVKGVGYVRLRGFHKRVFLWYGPLDKRNRIFPELDALLVGDEIDQLHFFPTHDQPGMSAVSQVVAVVVPVIDRHAAVVGVAQTRLMSGRIPGLVAVIAVQHLPLWYYIGTVYIWLCLNQRQ